MAALDPADGPIDQVQTHVSNLVFQDGWVYKVKRPVHYEFIDLSTAELRQFICEREVALNRRFAPDVYDSVIPICDRNGAVVDHAVRMRRMPAARRLATLAAAHDPRAALAARQVARIIATAHAAAPHGPDIDAVALPQAICKLWDRSLDDMQRFTGVYIDHDLLDSVSSRAHRYLSGREPLLMQRIADGNIVDGHGDLMSSDIFCLDDGPRILDCLEFDDALRYGDVLLDIAFLVMDLERVGRSDLADQFVRGYVEFSNEHHPTSLLHHYVAYRAVVRSKVACLRGADGDLAAASEAGALLALATSRLDAACVRLILVGGLPGSGKSTLAEDLGAATGALVLSSDVVRKEMVGTGPVAQPAAFGEGIYSPEITAHTYGVLMERAHTALAHGQSVVLDASFGEHIWRERARVVAEATSSELVELRCTAPTAVREARLRARPYDRTRPSDATVGIAERMAAQANVWPESTRLDTSSSPEQSLRRAVAALL